MYLFETLPPKCIKYSPHLIIKYMSIPILVNKIEWPTSHNIYVGISLSEFCSKLPPPSYTYNYLFTGIPIDFIVYQTPPSPFFFYIFPGELLVKHP